MGDVIIDVETMNTLEGYCKNCSSKAKSAKNKLETLRVTMANMYSGQAYDNVQTGIDMLRSQYTLIMNSYDVLADYVRGVKDLMVTNDDHLGTRAAEVIDYTTPNGD
ncbi:MAG: hypothetical protein K6G10_09565 [Butyrivibrio sp.]|nr:hypothetical protein [Butyrivibrio sp.]